MYETHYFKPFSNCYVKLYLVYFRNFNMLFKNYVIEKQICKCYLWIQDYSFPLFQPFKGAL